MFAIRDRIALAESETLDASPRHLVDDRWCWIVRSQTRSTRLVIPTDDPNTVLVVHPNGDAERVALLPIRVIA